MGKALQRDEDSGDSPLYFTSVPFAQGCLKASVPVFHGFFGRSGGFSTGIYASLNCGAGSDDHVGDVINNRRLVADVAGCEPENLLGLHQIHSDICVSVTKPWSSHAKPQADAMVTDQRGLALGILTADCAPVLFIGAKADGAPVIGAAHAGWGGALKGILASTVAHMLALGAMQDSLQACIGPCIGKASYEVTDEFMQPFLAEDPENERFFMSGKRAGHGLFDLPGYCAAKLAKAGVGKVFIKDLDTYFNEEDFFSYRRTTHRKETDYGRQISVIAIGEG